MRVWWQTRYTATDRPTRSSGIPEPSTAWKVPESLLRMSRIVTPSKVTAGAGGRSGLNEAATENARRRRYRPGTKDGVPVKVWIPITVNFVLPR